MSSRDSEEKHGRDEMNEQESIRENNNTDERRNVRLTMRDKELLAHVAVARYLTSTQIRQVVFPTKGGADQRSPADEAKHSSAVVCRRRLKALSSGNSGAPYLRRLSFRNAENAPASVFAVTPQGQAIAGELLRRPMPAPGETMTPQLLARSVRITELYVSLAIGAHELRRDPRKLPFLWIATNVTALPWRELNHRTGKLENRRLVPDAVLELPHHKTRVFLEDEMGAGPLPRRDQHAANWALCTLRQYGSFMAEGAQRTFYEQEYPDRWKAELVLLVHSDERAVKSGGVIEEWRKWNRAVPLQVRALTLSQAANHFRDRLGASPPSSDVMRIDRADLKLTFSFVAEVMATYKAVRHFLRANPNVHAQGCPYPQYTPEFERMVALVHRVRTQLGGSQRDRER